MPNRAYNPEDARSWFAKASQATGAPNGEALKFLQNLGLTLASLNRAVSRINTIETDIGDITNNVTNVYTFKDVQYAVAGVDMTVAGSTAFGTTIVDTAYRFIPKELTIIPTSLSGCTVNPQAGLGIASDTQDIFPVIELPGCDTATVDVTCWSQDLSNGQQSKLIQPASDMYFYVETPAVATVFLATVVVRGFYLSTAYL